MDAQDVVQQSSFAPHRARHDFGPVTRAQTRPRYRWRWRAVVPVLLLASLTASPDARAQALSKSDSGIGLKEVHAQSRPALTLRSIRGACERGDEAPAWAQRHRQRIVTGDAARGFHERVVVGPVGDDGCRKRAVAEP